jgi:hypothetical protein
MNKDRFGFGVEKEDPVIRRIAEDFGDSYGNDLSMFVIQHYKDTGDVINYKDIDDTMIKMFKSKYPNY